MSTLVTPRNALVVAVVVLLALVPVYAALSGNTFLMSLFTRIVILAMAAVSLNLIMGFGGMVSFGHAAYLGIGGYVVGILAKEGVNSGFVQWPLALAVSALFALAVGALSLRTRGVYFIMITLAFAQMIYYVAIGLDRYGGDDGMTIYKRSQFGDLISLSNKTAVLLSLPRAAAGHRLPGLARRELALRHGDPGRALERPPHARDRLSHLSLQAGLLRHRRHICGLAGALLANHTDFISPAIMHWTRSGDLIVMAVLGGMGTVFGPVLGAVALLVLEEALSSGVTGILADRWHLRPIFLLVVLFARGGIDGLVAGARRG